MKLLTLNTHSLEESDYKKKTQYFVEAIEEIRPQIIALQEVNQSEKASVLSSELLQGFCSAQEATTVRADNHLAGLACSLRERDIFYHWTWVPIKRAYDRYDEGIGLMSLSPITAVKVITVSNSHSYENWKTRRIVGIQTEATGDDWYFSVHYSWWMDEEEPFLDQWKRTEQALADCESVWLMGDFNNPAEAKQEGYDVMRATRYRDSYQEAKKRDEGITVDHVIDGWRDKLSGCNGMRIDQIWFTKSEEILSSRVIFNGAYYPVVSDHFGLLVEKK